MIVIALETEIPGFSAGDFEPHLEAEARRVRELQREGVLRRIHFRADRRLAVLELECANGEEAGKILATLPLVRAGLIRFEIIPLVPYTGFDRLFAE
jgi:hypothetical protein